MSVVYVFKVKWGEGNSKSTFFGFNRDVGYYILISFRYALCRFYCLFDNGLRNSTFVIVAGFTGFTGGGKVPCILDRWVTLYRIWKRTKLLTQRILLSWYFCLLYCVGAARLRCFLRLFDRLLLCFVHFLYYGFYMTFYIINMSSNATTICGRAARKIRPMLAGFFR